MQLDDRIGRRMKLHDLNVLMAVAQAGSMNKAARQLHTTQPAISRSISQLEHALGVRLLDRKRQGVELTEYGRALFDGGTAVFDDLRRAVKTIEFLADPTVGEIRIGANEAIVAGLLPTVYGQLHRRHPGVAIRVTQPATIQQQLHELRERNVDLVLGRIPKLIEPDVAVEVLYHDRTVVAAGINNKWARRRRIKLTDLADEPWTVPHPDTLIGSLVAEAFRSSGLPYPPKGVAMGSIHLHSALIASGPFVGTFPGSVLKFGTNLPPLKVLPVELPIAPWPVGIMSVKNRTLSPAARLFVDFARDVTKPLTKVRL